MEAWKKIIAKDFCLNVTDGTHDSPHRVTEGKYLVTSKHIKDNKIDLGSAYKISTEDYNKIIQRSKVDQWDIIISMIGEYCGFCYLESNPTPEYAIKNVGLFKVGDELKSRWLFYYLNSPQGKQQLFQLRSGSTQPYITLNSLRNISIPTPSEKEMQFVVDILKSIDDKIELNNRINHNLEQQAQALYKSWFVDFEPFKNETFMESELGMIPKGWKTGMLSDLLEVRYGKDHKNLADGTVPVYGSGGLMRYAEKALYENESVLIPRKGTLNNVMYVSKPFWTVDTMFYTVEKAINSIKYCHQFLHTQDLASMNAGSAVPSMTTEILNNLKLIIPSDSVLKDFNRVVSSLYTNIECRISETGKLMAYRDSILPKLMSGEELITC